MSSLRKDLVSGDWIISAPERISRPSDFIPKKKKRRSPAIGRCPFEDKKLRSSAGSWPPIVSYPNEREWRVAVINNKYPALTHRETPAKARQEGPYSLLEGVGHHDIVITRDHKKNIADLPLNRAVEVFEVIKRHYRELKKDKSLLYSSIFFNWGPSAGASIAHPHYQILTLPIVPPDINHSLSGSARYFRKHKKCPHCEIIRYELEEKRRILDKNAAALSFAPFVSRQPFEIRVFPRRHLARFEETTSTELKDVVGILRKAIKRVRKNLNDPDLNFFIHTAPFRDHGHYIHYHWHIEVIPKITIPAGFELSTGVEINVVDPDQAASILRKKI